jgi:alpha-tubulin suppressor-like RCC1 family protein
LTFADLRTGSSHTCGTTSDGHAYCWGNDATGELGDGYAITQRMPGPVSGGQTFTWIAGGESFACGVTTSGSALCWGRNDTGQLGDGTTVSRNSPTSVMGGLTFATVDAGWYHACGLTTAGAAWCWGSGPYGELGTGQARGIASPPVAVSGGLVFRSISAGWYRSCAIAADSTLYCWGLNNGGQLGDGTTTDRAAPTAVTGGRKFLLVAAGESSTCGIAADSTAWCWGYGVGGRLGNGTLTSSNVPVAVSGGLKFRMLHIGYGHTCGVANSGRVYCWGRDWYGMQGNGQPLVDQLVPGAVSGSLTFTAVGGGRYHTCGIAVGGRGYCWGANFGGRIGSGTWPDSGSSVPVQVAGGSQLVSLGVAQMHTCALDASGMAFCWGDNGNGELGRGRFSWSASPLAVDFPTPVSLAAAVPISHVTRGGPRP